MSSRKRPKPSEAPSVRSPSPPEPCRPTRTQKSRLGHSCPPSAAGTRWDCCSALRRSCCKSHGLCVRLSLANLRTLAILDPLNVLESIILLFLPLPLCACACASFIFFHRVLLLLLVLLLLMLVLLIVLVLVLLLVLMLPLVLVLLPCSDLNHRLSFSIFPAPKVCSTSCNPTSP